MVIHDISIGSDVTEAPVERFGFLTEVNVVMTITIVLRIETGTLNAEDEISCVVISFIPTAIPFEDEKVKVEIRYKD